MQDTASFPTEAIPPVFIASVECRMARAVLLEEQWLLLVTLVTLLTSRVFCEETTSRQALEVQSEVEEMLFLTSYIKKNNETESARNAALVVGIHPEVVSYSGYLTVNQNYSSNLFFWFFPAKYNKEEAPLILWLQGGPGLSTLIGLFIEHGPFLVDKDNHIQLREHSWAHNHSVLYVDQPVGTGFSFTQDPAGNAKNQEDIVRDLYNFIEQFFALFPEYRKNDLYIAGQSYGGKYVPSISWKILQENVAAAQKFNLKGLIIGNGLTDPMNQFQYSDFFYNLGLMDDTGRDGMKKKENLFQQLLKTGKRQQALEVIDELIIADLNPYPSYSVNITGLNNTFFNLIWNEDDLKDWDYYQSFVKQSKIKKILHVGNANHSHVSKTVFSEMRDDIVNTTKPILEKILQNGTVRVLLYHGLLDLLIPYPGTRKFYNSLSWNGREEYLSATRKIWKFQDKVAGYVKQARNFATVAIRNAGHAVPYDQPAIAAEMISRFTQGKSFV